MIGQEDAWREQVCWYLGIVDICFLFKAHVHNFGTFSVGIEHMLTK